MSRLKVVSKASIVGGGRHDYISKVKVREHEATVGNARPLFSDKANRLSARNAQTLLKDKIEDNTTREIIVALSQEHFDQLGSTVEEREHFLRTGIRQGMKTLLKEMKATDANWVAAIHRNTDAPHVHILIGEKFHGEVKGTKTVKSLPEDKPLPKSLLASENGETVLNNIFIKEIEKHWIGLQPTEQKINAENKSYLLPPNSAQFYENGFTYLTGQMVNPKIVGRIENKTLLYRESGSPVFVKRDAEGNVTGGIWQSNKEVGTRKWLETGKGNGWFYTGNLKTAAKRVVVDSPLEAIAIESLYHKKDLSKVAFINLGNKENVEEFLDLVEEASRNKPLEIVWSKSRTSRTAGDEFVQNSAGRKDVEELVDSLREQGKQITLKNFQPRIAKTWAEELQLEETIRLQEWKAIIANQFVQKNYLKASASDAEFSDIRQIDTLPAKKEILDGTAARDWKLRKEAENIESQKPSEEDLRKIRQRVQEFKNERYQKETEELRKIPISWVANLFGLEKEHGAWTNGAKEFKLKIWEDRNTFDDYYNSKKLGTDPAGFRRAGAVNLAIYLSNHSLTYQEAREMLVDRFIGSQSSELPELKKKPILAEPLKLSERDDEKLEQVIGYLEERGISAETIELVVNNKTLFANNYGSAVFVMRDFDGAVIGHNWRSTQKGDTRRQNTPGTFKEFGSFYLGDPRTAKELVLVEAPIEALSYYEVNKSKDWTNTAVVSLHGISITETLADFIKTGEVEKVTVALNNSVEADKVAAKLKESFEATQKTVSVEAPFIGEDWNDYLVSLQTEESLMEGDLLSAEFALHEADDVTEQVGSFDELSKILALDVMPEIPVGNAAEESISVADAVNVIPVEAEIIDEPVVLRVEGKQFETVNKEDFRPIFNEAFDRFIDDHPRQESLKIFKADFVDAALSLALSTGADVGELAKGRKRLASEKILYVIEEQSGEYVKRPEAFLLESVLQTTLPSSPVGLDGFWSSLRRNGIEIFTNERLAGNNLEQYKLGENEYFEDEIVSIVETENPLILEARLSSGLVWQGTAESAGQVFIQAQAYSSTVMRHADALNRRGEYLRKNIESHQLETETSTVRLNVVYDDFDGLYRSGFEAATSNDYQERLLDVRAPGFRSRKEAINYSQEAISDFLTSQGENYDLVKTQIDEKLFGIKPPKPVEQIPVETAEEIVEAAAPKIVGAEETPVQSGPELVENVHLVLNKQSELKKDRIANQYITKFEREDLAAALRLFNLSELERVEMSQTLVYLTADPDELKSLSGEERKAVVERISNVEKAYGKYLINIPTTKFIDNPDFVETDGDETSPIPAKIEVALSGGERLDLLIEANQEAFSRYNAELGKFKEGEERVSFLSLQTFRLENGNYKTEIKGDFWSDVHQKAESEYDLFGEVESKRGGYEKETFVLDTVSASAENENKLVAQIEALSKAVNHLNTINTDEVFKPVLDKATVSLQVRLENVSEQYNRIIEQEKHKEWLDSKDLVSYNKHKSTHKFVFSDGIEWKGEALSVEAALEKANSFREGLKLRENLVNAKGEYLPQVFQTEEIWAGNGALHFNYLQDAVDSQFRGYIEINIENERKSRKINFLHSGSDDLVTLKAKSALEAQRIIKGDIAPRAGLANKGKFEDALRALEAFERESYEQLEEKTKGESQSEEIAGREENDGRNDGDGNGNANREIEDSGREKFESSSEKAESQISGSETQTDISDKLKAKFSGHWVSGDFSGIEGNIFELNRSFTLIEAKTILGSKGMDSLMFEHLNDAKPFTKTDGREIYDVLLNDLGYRLKGSDFGDLPAEDKVFIAERVAEKLGRNGFTGILVSENAGVLFDEAAALSFKSGAANKSDVAGLESQPEEKTPAAAEASATDRRIDVSDTSVADEKLSLTLSGQALDDASQLNEFLIEKTGNLPTVNELMNYFYGDGNTEGFWKSVNTINQNNPNFASQTGRESYLQNVLPKYLYKEMNKASGSRMKQTEDLITYFETFGAKGLKISEGEIAAAGESFTNAIDGAQIESLTANPQLNSNAAENLTDSASGANSTLTIGFANDYYTLWRVTNHAGGGQHCYYIQNLSTDFEKAKTKVAEISDNFEVDLTLRGEESFFKKPRYETHEFSFGKLAGQDIRESEDVWQLNRARQHEFNEDTRALALNRLMELDEIFEVDGSWYTKQELALKAERDAEINGWHLKNGERVTLDLVVKVTTWTTGAYGSTAFQLLKDKENRLYKYLGSSPLAVEKNEIITVKGTIEHSEYQGQKETRLKRLKLVETEEKRFVENNEEVKDLADIPIDSGKLQQSFEASEENTADNLRLVPAVAAATAPAARVLNDNEHQVFISLGQQILDSTGGQFGYAGDAEIPVGMTENQFKGYVGQLKQKGYFRISDDEFTQLSIGDKFEEYANAHNLFVGENFEKSLDFITIVGQSQVVAAAVTEIQPITAVEPSAANELAAADILSEEDFYNRDNFVRKIGEQGQVFNRLESVSRNNLVKYEIFDGTSLKIADLSKAITARQMIEIKISQLNTSLEQLENSESVADKIVLNREIGKLDGYLMTIEDLDSKNLPVPFSFKNANDLGLNQIARELQYDGVKTDSKIELFDERQPVLIGNADYETYRAGVEIAKGRNELSESQAPVAAEQPSRLKQGKGEVLPGSLLQPYEISRADAPDHIDIAKALPNAVNAPTPNEIAEGTYSIERIGDDPYVFQMQYINPHEIDYSEKYDSEATVINYPTTQQYINWYKDGIEPEPISVVYNQPTQTLTSLNRRRLVAARAAGVEKIPAWIELGKHKEIIEKAIGEGKEVPAKVIAGYADLAAKYAPPTVAEAPVEAPPISFYKIDTSEEAGRKLVSSFYRKSGDTEKMTAFGYKRYIWGDETSIREKISQWKKADNISDEKEGELIKPVADERIKEGVQTFRRKIWEINQNDYISQQYVLKQLLAEEHIDSAKARIANFENEAETRKLRKGESTDLSSLRLALPSMEERLKISS